ncbi:MAG: hypothetical protein L3K08_03755, partial [Thermoplasmata archaeon]|nr:hypothetical protein [Thermoplasmata archaeon]
MRLALAAGIAAVFVLAGLAVGSPLVHSVPAPRTSAHSAPGGVREAPSHPDLTIPRNIRFGLLNATLPVHSAVGGPPTSSVPETPSPVLPSTVPTEISFPQSVVTCCVYANFTAPTGPWAAIEFTDTGTVVGSVYDSSYRAYIDGAQFLEGTTPEYGTWTVHSDLTQYSALFRGTVNLTFILSAATLGGHFVTNVSLAFYPVPAGTAAPQTPTDVVPLWAWDHTYLHAANAKVFANATIPANVTNATLQLFVYGFGPTDEFWYSAQPGFRQAMVSVDGAILSAVYPFPYLNTGGIDLFLWRPVTSDFTINDRPYDVDVSGSIGLLEGTHEFVANVSGGLDGNTWLVGGSLLLYTASNAGAATSTQYAVERVPVSHQSGATYDDSSSTTTLTTSSTFDLGKAPVNVTTDLAESFSNQQTFTQGASSVQNVSQDERLTTVSYENSTNSSVVTERSLHFPLVLNLSNSQVKVSSTATTTTYNFTSAISEFHQEWQESDATGNGTATAINGPTARVDDLTTAQGAYSGQETANNAGGGATIDALFGSVSAISKSYTASVLGGSPSWTYTHLLTAAGNNPPGPFNAQTLLTNSVSDPMTAAAAAVPSTIDLGGTAELSAWGVGGDGQYHFAWLGLPMGCRSTDSATLHCIPSAAGSYSPSVTVTDAGTNATTVALGPLVVEPRL